MSRPTRDSACSSRLVGSPRKRWASIVALASALLCAYAAVSRNFWLLCLATLVAGYYNANAGLYRFAAAELIV